MSVQFEEQDFYQSNARPQGENIGPVTKLFMKIGLVKDERSANIPMMVVAVICFSLAIFFFTR